MMIGDIAHICNRGVDKRKIFSDHSDYERFRNNLFLLNNEEGKLRTKHKNLFDSNIKLPERKKLVEIFKWSLLPNHYHLLLYENVDGGIIEFTKRLGNAYTKYFNIRHGDRSGYLFQNSAKIVSIGNEAHFPYLPIYIDLNAKDLFAGLPEEIFDSLKAYKWSSMKEYFGKGNERLIINSDLFYEVFNTDKERYTKDLKGFLFDSKDLEAELGLRGVNLAG